MLYEGQEALKELPAASCSSVLTWRRRRSTARSICSLLTVYVAPSLWRYIFNFNDMTMAFITFFAQLLSPLA